MEEALTSALLSDPALQLLVADRVHWGRLPQSESDTPFVILQLISGGVDYHNGGSSALSNPRVQVDAYGDAYLSALAVARRLAQIFNGLSVTVSGVRFHIGFQVSERDFTSTDPSETSRYFRRSADFTLWHSA